MFLGWINLESLFTGVPGLRELGRISGGSRLAYAITAMAFHRVPMDFLDVDCMIRVLREEKNQLEQLIISFEELERDAPVLSTRHRRKYSAKQRGEMEERMRADWESRHQ